MDCFGIDLGCEGGHTLRPLPVLSPDPKASRKGGLNQRGSAEAQRQMPDVANQAVRREEGMGWGPR